MGSPAFAAIHSVHGCPVDSWRAALAEQRKGVGEHRERHLERASRLREIGWEDRVTRPTAGIER